MILDGNIIPSDHHLISNDPLRIDRSIDADPWNAQGITSHPTSNTTYPSSARFITSRSTVDRPRGNCFSGYRLPAASNPESYIAPQYSHASFHGLPHAPDTGSIISGPEPFDVPLDDTSFYGDLNDAAIGMNLNLNLNNQQQQQQYNTVTQSYSPQLHIYSNSNPPSLYSQEFSNIERPIDIRKVAERPPKKIHRCDVPDCENLKGFTSSNDLDRHKKSVHSIALPHGRDKSFQCQAANCRRPDKIWPRLDNFKNHCKTCHKGQDLDDLVKRSEMKPEDQTQEQNSVAESDQNFEQTHPGISEDTIDDKSFFPSLQQTKEASLSIPADGRISKPTSTNDLAILSKREFSPPFVHQRPGLLSVRSEPTNTLTGHLDGVLTELAYPNAKLLGDDDEMTMNLPIKDRVSPMIRPIPSGMLRSFSSDLLEHISKVVNLEQVAMKRIAAAIDERVQQLALDISSKNEFPAASPDTTSTNLTQFGTPSRSEKKYQCLEPGCGKLYCRQSELKKHSTRHSRPYFCTSPDCTSEKTFGSKADWKRHENTLHLNHPSYRCREVSLVIHGEECGKPFHRAEPYTTHLRKDHGVTAEDYIQQKLGEKEIDPNFWCGYCRELIPISTDSDERFDHIEKHFKENLSLNEWIHQHNTLENALDYLSSSKIANELGRQSVTLNADYNDTMSDYRPYYRGHEEDAYAYPRSKRPRPQEPYSDWLSMTIPRETSSQTGNHWFSHTV